MDKLVLREDDIFVVSDAAGDIREEDGGGNGMYYHDTRYLSTLDITLNGDKLDILSSSSEQNFMANVQLANRTLHQENGQVILPHTISVRRNRFVKDGLHERVGLFNYNSDPVQVELAISFGGDFRDMFDVRGYGRPIRGKVLPPDAAKASVTLSYLGQDRDRRETRITFDVEPTRFEIEALPCEEELVQDTTLPDANTAINRTVRCSPRAKAIFQVALVPQTPFAVTLHIDPRGEDPVLGDKLFDGEIMGLRLSYDN